MKILLMLLTILTFVSTLVTGLFISLNRAVYVVGGEYTVPSGETIQGDLNILFAQVTLEDGAKVNGMIRTFSSNVILDGSVSEGILSMGSDVLGRQPGLSIESKKEIRILPLVVLLPKIAHTEISLSSK